MPCNVSWSGFVRGFRRLCSLPFILLVKFYQYCISPYTPPSYAQPVVTKDHVAAGLLAIFLGVFGVHKFYLGYNTSGFIMLAVTILGSIFTLGLAAGVMWVIALIEGIIYLAKSQSEFDAIYVANKKEWF